MALTEATIDAAEGAGCRTLVLVATDAGLPMYQRIGFEIQTEYRILEAPGLGGGAADPRIRAYRRDDLDVIAGLDRAATGEDRTHLLRAFASPATARCVIRADGIDRRVRHPGTVGRWRHDRAGPRTMRPRSSARDVSRPAPTSASAPVCWPRTSTGVEMLLHDGWSAAWEGPRLIRGEPLDWQPEAIWGQFNHAMG